MAGASRRPFGAGFESEPEEADGAALADFQFRGQRLISRAAQTMGMASPYSAAVGIAGTARTTCLRQREGELAADGSFDGANVIERQVELLPLHSYSGCKVKLHDPQGLPMLSRTSGSSRPDPQFNSRSAMGRRSSTRSLFRRLIATPIRSDTSACAVRQRRSRSGMRQGTAAA